MPSTSQATSRNSSTPRTSAVSRTTTPQTYVECRMATTAACGNACHTFGFPREHNLKRWLHDRPQALPDTSPGGCGDDPFAYRSCSCLSGMGVLPTQRSSRCDEGVLGLHGARRFPLLD